MLMNITTVVGIMYKGHSFEYEIYVWLIVIDLFIVTKCFFYGGVIIEYTCKR